VRRCWCSRVPLLRFSGSLPAASMKPRYYHTATLLSDGRVLVAGGTGPRPQTFPNPGLASTELYDPATDNWTVTGSLNAGRLLHTATLLLNGKVLVAGGWPDHTHNGIMKSAELYHPATGNWTPTIGMNVGRAGHTATLLFDGMVMVVGGLTWQLQQRGALRSRHGELEFHRQHHYSPLRLPHGDLAA
jgi:hypothetical protein